MYTVEVRATTPNISVNFTTKRISRYKHIVVIMLNWFKTLSSGNKVAFVLSAGIMTAAVAYSAASSFTAGSSVAAQQVLPSIISSLPQLSASPTPSPQPTNQPAPAATNQASSPAITASPAISQQSHSSHDANPANRSKNNNKNTGNTSDDKAIPAGAGALCHDGSYSFSLTDRGACAHHGGVDKWLQDSGTNRD